MIMSPTTLIQNALKRFDIAVTRYGRLHSLERLAEAGYATNYLSNVPPGSAPQLLRVIQGTKSQLRQDLFVLAELNFKTNGFFVEFGAANGIDLSNTYLLESSFGWQGILAEPARCWHSALRANRACHIETDCVWYESDSVLKFNETQPSECSGVKMNGPTDLHDRVRENGKIYEVRTISLVDLLARYNAPKIIDYLSMDTEGSEYSILKGFDFERYQFRVITCEHNYSPQREKIFDLLTAKGYRRKFEESSAFDDWYVKKDDLL